MSSLKENREAICKLVLEISGAEKRVEISKQIMLDMLDFSSVALFRLLTDRERIEIHHIEDFLLTRGAVLDQDDLEILFDSLGRDGYGVVS